MKSTQDTENLISLVVILITIAAIFVFICLQPLFESRTYNKLTGAKTTWWDAVWVELRVNDSTAR